MYNLILQIYTTYLVRHDLCSPPLLVCLGAEGNVIDLKYFRTKINKMSWTSGHYICRKWALFDTLPPAFLPMPFERGQYPYNILE